LGINLPKTLRENHGALVEYEATVTSSRQVTLPKKFYLYNESATK